MKRSTSEDWRVPLSFTWNLLTLNRSYNGRYRKVYYVLSHCLYGLLFRYSQLSPLTALEVFPKKDKRSVVLFVVPIVARKKGSSRQYMSQREQKSRLVTSGWSAILIWWITVE